MSESIHVRPADLVAVADDIASSAGSTSRVAEALRQLTAPDGRAFGNGSGGVAAHTEYQRVHEILTLLTNGISRHLTALSEAMSRAAHTYSAAQTHAMEAILRLS